MTSIFNDKTLGPVKYYNISKRSFLLKKFNFFLIFLMFSVSMIMSFDNVTFAQTESAPEPVTDLIAIPNNEEIHLSWSAPDDNGSPITSYRIIVNEKGSSVTTTYPNIGDIERATILGLKNDVAYQFKVAAVNEIGIGKESPPVTSTPNNRVPIVITNLKAVPGDGKVTLSWSVSSTDLDSITGYRVREFKTGSDSFVTHSILGKTTSVTIDSLTNGVSYGFKVIGVNADGIGTDSNFVYATPVSSLITSGKVPSPINNLKISPDDSQVKLTWRPQTIMVFQSQDTKLFNLY